MKYLMYIKWVVVVMFLWEGCVPPEESTKWELVDAWTSPGFYRDTTPTLTDLPVVICMNRQWRDMLGGENIMYYEWHSHKVRYIDKTMNFEIPDSSGRQSFYFEGRELLDSLKCGATWGEGSTDYCSFLVEEGYIRGEKVDGEWEIDFDIRFGDGETEYRMISGARY